MKKILTLALLVLILSFSFVQNSTSIPKKQSDPDFSEVTVTTSSNHLLLYGTLENGFTDEMVRGLHTGLPIHFSFFIELVPAAKNWDGEPLALLETNHVINYDTLKDIYKVEIEESGKRFFTFTKLEQAQKMANEINGLKVIELSQIQPDISYTLRIRAELYKKTLPMGLHKVVPFVSWWDIKTQWHTVTFNL